MIFTEAFSPTSKAKINSSGDREWVLWGKAEPKICVCGKGKHVHQISGGMFECWVQHVGGGRGVGGYINLGAMKSLLLCAKRAPILVSHINLLCMVSTAVPKIIHSNRKKIVSGVISRATDLSGWCAMHWMKCQSCAISQLQTCPIIIHHYPFFLFHSNNMLTLVVCLLVVFVTPVCAGKMLNCA